MQSVRKRSRSLSKEPPEVRLVAAGQTHGEGDETIQSKAISPASGDPNVVRLNLVLALLAEGKSQEEIAARIGRDPRTVRRMISQAKEMGLSVSEDLRPGDAVTRVIQTFSELKADLIDLKRQAEAEGNFKHQIACAKELLRIELAFVATLDRIGFFEGFKPLPAETIDPEMARANKLFDMAQDLVASDEADSPDDTAGRTAKRDESDDPGP